MGGFVVHLMTEGTIRLLHDENIKEGELVVGFKLLGERNGQGKLVDVTKWSG